MTIVLRRVSYFISLILGIVIVFAFSGWPMTAAAKVPDTPTPTDTTDNTSTPVVPPTDTPSASDTPEPTATPTLPDTPESSDTPLATETPMPSDSVTETPTATDTPTSTETATPTSTPGHEKGNGNGHLSGVLQELYDSYTKHGRSEAAKFAQTNGIDLQRHDDNVRVVVMLEPGHDRDVAMKIVAALKGTAEASADNLIQISLPIRHLPVLASNPVFSGVRLPRNAIEASGPGRGTIIDQGIAQTNADVWQNAGITGKGVKVGIIDTGFNGYTALLGTDLPPSTMVHVKSFRADLNLLASSHGTHVAQIVSDMAPDAELWLVNFSTDVEYAEAMDYLISQHVQIINGSVNWMNVTPGDGTGYLEDSVTRVANAGILYVASAGDYTDHVQKAYTSTVQSIPGNNNLFFPEDYATWSGPTVFNQINGWTCPKASCNLQIDLSWNGWSGSYTTQDFDLYVLQSTDGGLTWPTIPASSLNQQINGYPWPEERINATIPAGGQLAIVIQDPFAGQVTPPPGGWNLNMFISSSDLSGVQLADNLPEYSLLQPADSADAFTVGAMNTANYNTVALPEITSASGPINAPDEGVPTGGEPIKPDLLAPDCTNTTGNPGGFCGTSGAAPHVAGAAALILQAFPTYTPTDLRIFLTDPGRALNPWAAVLPDPQFGNGELFLGTAPNTIFCTPGTATCAGTGWPEFQNSMAHTANTAVTVPTGGVGGIWGLTLSAATHSPVISQTDPDLMDPTGTVHLTDGGVYTIAGRYVVAANVDTGEKLWQFDLGSSGAPTGNEAPALTDYNNNGTVGNSTDDVMYLYVGSADGYLYKLNAINGTQVCKSSKIGLNFGKASPTIGPDGTIYLTDANTPVKLAAVQPDCSLKWSVKLGTGAGTSSPTFVGSLILVGADKPYLVNKYGVVAPASGPLVAVPSTFAVVQTNLGEDPYYYVGADGSLYSWAGTGAATKVFTAPVGVHASGSLAVYEYNVFPNHKSFIYWGHLGVLYRYDTDTNTTISLALSGNLADSSPIVDGAGNVFIGSTDGKVYGVDADGVTMTMLSGWPLLAGGSTAGGLAVSPANLTLFVPSTDFNLRAYNVFSQCPACILDPDAKWPVFQGNAAHTGRVGGPASASPLLRWTLNLGGPAFQPVFSEYNPDYPYLLGYWITGRYLRGVDIYNKSPIWSYDLGVNGAPLGYAAPALIDQNTAIPAHPNGIIYVGGRDGILHAADALTGQRVWATTVGTDVSKVSPVVDDSGMIYVVDYTSASSNLVAVTHLGGIAWKRPIGAGLGTSSPTIVKDILGTRIFVGGDTLYCFVQSGATCSNWPAGGHALGAGTKVSSTPLFTGGNRVFVLNNLGDLYSIDTSLIGAVPLLELTHPVTGAGSGSLAFNYNCGTNGCVYWGFAGKLIRYDFDAAANKTTIVNLHGTKNNPAALTPVAVTANASPIIDFDGRVYIGTGGTNTMYLYPGTGSIATAFYTAASSLAGSGAFGHLGLNEDAVFWPAANGDLLGFGTALPGACVSCAVPGQNWSTYQNSMQHNSASASPGGHTIREVGKIVLPVAPVRAPLVQPSNNALYFVSGKYLYARKISNGTPLWTSGSVELKYNLGASATAGTFGMPLLGYDDDRPVGDKLMIIVGGSNGVLHAVSAKTGTKVWTLTLGGNLSKASLTLGNNGYIVVVQDNPSPTSDRLYVVTWYGNVLWSQPIGNSNGTSSPAIDDSILYGDPIDDRVLVGGGAGLYAFDLITGNPAAGFPAVIGKVHGAPVVSSSGPTLVGYYVVTAAGNLVRVDAAGTATTLITNSAPANTFKSGGLLIQTGCWNQPTCAVGSDFFTDIFFGLGNTLYRFRDSEGADPNKQNPTDTNTIASKVVLGGDLGDSTPLSTSALIDGMSGFIYIGSTDGKLYVVGDTLTPLDTMVLAYSTVPAGGSMAGPGSGNTADDPMYWPSQNGVIHIYASSRITALPTDTDLQWPQAQRDSSRTGKSAQVLDPNAVEQWALPTGTAVKPPVLGDVNQPSSSFVTGVAYSVSGHYLYAINMLSSRVEKQWDLGAGNGVSGYASPAVVRLDPNNTPANPYDDRNMVIVTDLKGKVTAYGADGSQWVNAPFWSNKVGMNLSNASPLVGPNNLVYVVDAASPNKLIAVSLKNGAVVWSATLGAGTGKSSPVYYNDGTTGWVIVGADKLYWVNAATGVVDTTRTCIFPVGVTNISNPNIADQDTTPSNGNELTYVLASNNITTQLYVMPPTGCVGGNPGAIGAPITGSIGASGLAYRNHGGGNFYIFFAVDKTLYRFDSAGGPGSTPAAITLGSLAKNFYNSMPLVDNSGKVYIGGADGFLYGVDAAPTPMQALGPAYSSVFRTGWPKPIGAGTTATSAAGLLAMDTQGSLYVPSLDGRLRRFGPAPFPCSCGLYTDAPWPMFQHDAQHSGHNPNGAGHPTPTVHWSANTVSPIVPPRTVVVSPPTTTYPQGLVVGTSGRKVVARNATNGTIVWQYDLGVAGTPSGGASPALMVLSDNGNGCIDLATCDDDYVLVIVGAADGYLYGLKLYNSDPNYTLYWRVKLGANVSKSSPVIGPDGTVYVVEDGTTDRLDAVYYNGTLRWSQPLGAGTGASSPVIDAAHNRVFAGSANKLYGFTLAGGVAPGYPQTMPGTGLVNTSPMLDNHGHLWVLNSLGRLFRLDPTGAITTPTLVYPASTATVVGTVGDGVAPAFEDDPTANIGETYIYYTAGVKLLRTRVVTVSGIKAGETTSFILKSTAGTASPVIDGNSWVYALDASGYLSAFDRYVSANNGAFIRIFIKKLATKGTLVGGITIDNEGNLYVPDRNSAIYRVSAP